MMCCRLCVGAALCRDGHTEASLAWPYAIQLLEQQADKHRTRAINSRRMATCERNAAHKDVRSLIINLSKQWQQLAALKVGFCDAPTSRCSFVSLRTRKPALTQLLEKLSSCSSSTFSGVCLMFMSFQPRCGSGFVQPRHILCFLGL